MLTPKTEELFLKLKSLQEVGAKIEPREIGSYADMELLADRMLFILWELEGSGYWTKI